MEAPGPFPKDDGFDRNEGTCPTPPRVAPWGLPGAYSSPPVTRQTQRRKGKVVVATRKALPKLIRHHARAMGDPRPVRNKALREFFEEKIVSAAHHEGGHLVVLYYETLELARSISLMVGEDGNWGRVGANGFNPLTAKEEFSFHVRQRGKHWAEDWVDRKVRPILAGYAVDRAREKDEGPWDEFILSMREQYEFDAEEQQGAAQDDIEDAFSFLAPFEPNEKRRLRRLCRLGEETQELVGAPKIARVIERVAEALLNKPVLDRDDFGPLLDDLPPRALSVTGAKGLSR